MQKIAFKNYRYPLRESNQFSLLIDGDMYFSAMLKAINQASTYILLEQYLVTSCAITDQFIRRLVQAAERGVAVYLLLDDFGASGLNAQDRQRLHTAGIQLCFFNPVRYKRFFNSLFRNHRKSLVIDNQFAYVGGAGFTDEFSNEHYGSQAWHDVMLEIRGEAIADWRDLFLKTWQDHAKQTIELPDLPCLPTGHQVGRVLTAAPLRRQEINRSLIKHLRRARQHAWITSPYFVTTRKIRRTLRQVARRGVDVRLLMPGQYSDHPWISFAARRHYTRLLRHGVRIFEFQPRFIHAKLELVDNWGSIGSSNLDRWNQRWNLDANQTIYGTEFAQQARELFMQDFAQSIEITYETWQQRPWLTRLREKLSGQVVYWLEKIIRSRHG